jgi:hypothetical protein
MQLKSLSTSLSNGSPWSTTVSILLWIVLWLLIFEIVLYAISYMPPNKLSNAVLRYLEYGRSVEGKMHKMIGPTDELTVPIASVGWLEPLQWRNKPSYPKNSEDLLIAIYGMSFAKHVGKVLPKLDSRVTIRLVAAPGAPPTHAYTAYLLDKEQHAAQVVIMGISATTLVSMTTLTPMNKYFEYPMPFTYPKYSLVENRLKVLWPKVRHFADLRRFLNDKALWEEYRQQLIAQDSYYDPFLFNQNFADNLAIIRFIRRAYAKRHAGSVSKTIHSSQGFFEHSEEIQVLRLIIKEFARQVRSNNQLPVLMLFNNRGYSDHLYQILAETIAEINIPTMSSHTIAPAEKLYNFLPDGHFTHAVNKQLGEAVIEILYEKKLLERK